MSGNGVILVYSLGGELNLALFNINLNFGVHAGIVRTLQRVREMAWWSGVSTFVCNKVASCVIFSNSHRMRQGRHL